MAGAGYGLTRPKERKMKHNQCPWSLEELKELLKGAGVKVVEHGEYFELIGQYGLGNVEKDNPAICWIFWAFWTGYSSK